MLCTWFHLPCRLLPLVLVQVGGGEVCGLTTGAKALFCFTAETMLAGEKEKIPEELLQFEGRLVEEAIVGLDGTTRRKKDPPKKAFLSIRASVSCRNGRNQLLLCTGSNFKWPRPLLQFDFCLVVKCDQSLQEEHLFCFVLQVFGAVILGALKHPLNSVTAMFYPYNNPVLPSCSKLF